MTLRGYPPSANPVPREFMVITIITRFQVHPDEKRLPITRYDKKSTSIRFNMQLCVRSASYGAGFRDVACWRRRSQAFLYRSGMDLDGLRTCRAVRTSCTLEKC